MKKSEFTSFIKEEIVNILSEDNHDEKSILAKAKAQAELNKELEKTKNLVGEEEDDKDAVKAAMKARGKFKKLDLATKAFKDLTTNMKSLARKYSASEDEGEREKIKDMLKAKTAQKKELESLLDKLEKNVV